MSTTSTRDLLDQVAAADRARAARQRHVDRLGGDARLERGCRTASLARVERRLERHADLVRDLADGRPLLGRKRAEPAQDAGERALLAEVRHAHRVERGQVVRRRDRREASSRSATSSSFDDSHAAVAPSVGQRLNRKGAGSPSLDTCPKDGSRLPRYHLGWPPLTRRPSRSQAHAAPRMLHGLSPVPSRYRGIRLPY